MAVEFTEPDILQGMSANESAAEQKTAQYDDSVTTEDKAATENEAFRTQATADDCAAESHFLREELQDEDRLDGPLPFIAAAGDHEADSQILEDTSN